MRPGTSGERWVQLVCSFQVELRYMETRKPLMQVGALLEACPELSEAEAEAALEQQGYRSILALQDTTTGSGPLVEFRLCFAGRRPRW